MSGNGTSFIARILDVRHRVNKRLRLAVGMCEVRNGVELQAEAERVFKEITDQDVDGEMRDYMVPSVEIEQDDSYDLRWRLHITMRSAVDRLGDLA